MRRALVGIFLALVAVYHANGRAHPEVDCVPAPYAAWSLVRHGSLDLRRYPTLQHYVGTCILEAPDGSWVSRYPLGSTLALVPFVAPFALFREAPLPDAQMHALGKLAAACYVAAAAALLFLLCRDLAPAGRWPATILFGLGTCLCSVASQAIWMHGPATFWLCCTLYLLLRAGGPTPAGSVAAGMALGLAVVTRPTTALVALATGITLLARRQWSQAARLALGGIVPVVVLCLVNGRQFGNPILGGYVAEYWNEPPPLWLGLTGLLVAPSRGVLIYSPALLLLPFGFKALCGRLPECGRQRRGLLVAWLVAAAATLVYYARWHEWRGGWCYGPRFLCEMMPICCLLFALAYGRLRARWQQGAAVGLVVLSVAIQLVGIFGYSAYESWQWRHELPDQGRCLLAVEDTQIQAHASAVARKVLGQTPGKR